jgi:hypothetical protein
MDSIVAPGINNALMVKDETKIETLGPFAWVLM